MSSPGQSSPGQGRRGWRPTASLADRFLVPGERPVIVVRRHMVVLVRPAAEFLLGTAVVSAVARTAESREIDTFVGWLVLALVARVLYAAVAWDRERITVTDKRLLLTSGVFTANVAVMPISKITDLSFRRSSLGLLLGYGELTIESAGQNQALNVLGYLPEPQLVYETVSQVVHTRRPERVPGLGGQPWPLGELEMVDDDLDDDGDDEDHLLLPPWVNDR